MPGVTPSSPRACRPVLQRSARRYLVIEGTDMSRLLEFDSTKCTRDGVCVAVCPSRIIRLEDESPIPSVVPDADFDCVKCGHCVTACPHGAVSHASMKPEDCPPVRPDLALDPDHVEHFLRSRRSVRSFQQRRVERKTLAKLIQIARYAPTGHNAQAVRWIAVDSPARVKEMAGITIDFLRSITDEGGPSELPAGALVKAWESGVDLVTRDAPALIVAHAPAGDPVACADPILALSYLELAAASFGLGACWNGFLMTAIHRWPPLSRALGLPEGDRALGVLILGYPAHKHLRLPTRRKPRIDWLE